MPKNKSLQGSARAVDPSDIDEMLSGAQPSESANAPTVDDASSKNVFRLLKGVFSTNNMSIDDILLDGERFDHQLKKLFAWIILIAVIGQVVLANIVLLLHLMFGFGGGVDSRVLIAWFSATVVEVIGLMAIVTRYLFPARGQRKKGK